MPRLPYNPVCGASKSLTCSFFGPGLAFSVPNLIDADTLFPFYVWIDVHERPLKLLGSSNPRPDCEKRVGSHYSAATVNLLPLFRIAEPALCL